MRSNDINGELRMSALTAPKYKSKGSDTLLDLAALEATPLQRDPFDHVIVENAIAPKHLDAILAGFPDVPGPGSHSPASLHIGAHFAVLLKELESDTFRHALERKFAIDLAGRPTVTTIRGELRASDGALHRDSPSKIVTVLLYLNRGWSSPGGRLRLLRSPNLDDFAVEIPPQAGTVLVFRRGETSWHGHAPFGGPRRAVQMSYVTDRAVAVRQERRHRLATSLKRVTRRLLPTGRA
jgi:SM-20-related protein